VRLPDHFRVYGSYAASVGAALVDVVANLYLVPKFNELDPDTFFTL